MGEKGNLSDDGGFIGTTSQAMPKASDGSWAKASDHPYAKGSHGSSGEAPDGKLAEQPGTDHAAMKGTRLGEEPGPVSSGGPMLAGGWAQPGRDDDAPDEPGTPGAGR
jgi:hypothetical protein